MAELFVWRRAKPHSLGTTANKFARRFGRRVVYILHVFGGLLRSFWVLPAVLAGAVFFACSSTETAGNSAEIGNPEFAGALTVGGEPAVAALVRCVPEGFDAFADSLPEAFQTVTDSAGNFAFDSVPSGTFALEAAHDSSATLLLELGLSSSDSAYEGELLEAGAVRLGASKYADGDTLHIAVLGTTIARLVVVEFGEIYLDSLPAMLLEGLQIEGSEVQFGEAVEVKSGEVSVVDSLSMVANFKFPLENSALADSLLSLPMALRLASGDLDFGLFASMEGAWTASRAGVSLPISNLLLDFDSELLTFWVLLDSLNLADTLTLTFTEGGEQSSENVFQKNFVAIWHFDEGVDSVADASGNGFTGTAEGVSETEGSVGKAFYYDGSTSHVAVSGTASSALNISFSSSMSVSAWVRLDALDESRRVFGKGTSQYHLKYEHPLGWQFERYTESDEGEALRYVYAQEDTLSEAGEWAMLTVVQNDTAFKLYVNDELTDTVASVEASEEAYDESGDFEIGRFVTAAGDSAGEYFIGAIDELSVMRIQLSEERIRAMYLNQRPSGYWPQPAGE